uniref:Uncharacterized protein n=1 Tax=Physcomitrium patens TaxID=3218 RepID=A0A2K1JHM0_PHYPA|nr:hypothetical protein PHYPA_018456 [Physcomitrium patens]
MSLGLHWVYFYFYELCFHTHSKSKHCRGVRYLSVIRFMTLRTYSTVLVRN